MSDYQQLADGYLAVWNQTDPAARSQQAVRVFTDDVAYTDPLADVRGLAGLDAVVTAAQQQFPGWTFRGSGPVDGHGSQLRFEWELGPQDGPAPVAGFDVAVLSEDGRIRQGARVPGPRAGLSPWSRGHDLAGHGLAAARSLACQG